MLKLLLCLITGMILAICVLQLRQQKLELNHQVNQLHNAIEDKQGKLWGQQLQIAVYTAPNAISRTVGEQNLKLLPPAPAVRGTSNWIDARRQDDEAE